jgi:hypothetical protein
MDTADEVLMSGPPGWKVSQVIRRWPVEIEIDSYLVEKEEDGQTRTAIRILLKCQGEPHKLVVREEGDEDRLLYEETLIAGYVFHHVVRAVLLAAEQVLQEAVWDATFGDDDWKEDWIDKAIKETNKEIRYRLRRKHGGSRLKREIAPAVLDVYYRRFLPIIQAIKKIVRKADPDWQSLAAETWERSGCSDLPSNALDELRETSPNEFALELAARYAMSHSFDRHSGFEIQVLKNIRTKHLRQCKQAEQIYQKAKEAKKKRDER